MDSKFQKSIIIVFFTLVSFASSKGEMCYKLRKYELHNFAEADNTKKNLSLCICFIIKIKLKSMWFSKNKVQTIFCNFICFRWKGGKGGNPNAALSALTLLAFLFFLNILQVITTKWFHLLILLNVYKQTWSLILE